MGQEPTCAAEEIEEPLRACFADEWLLLLRHAGVDRQGEKRLGSEMVMAEDGIMDWQ